jgi:hypothetical protein
MQRLQVQQLQAWHLNNDMIIVSGIMSITLLQKSFLSSLLAFDRSILQRHLSAAVEGLMVDCLHHCI